VKLIVRINGFFERRRIWQYVDRHTKYTDADLKIF